MVQTSPVLSGRPSSPGSPGQRGTMREQQGRSRDSRTPPGVRRAQLGKPLRRQDAQSLAGWQEYIMEKIESDKTLEKEERIKLQDLANHIAFQQAVRQVAVQCLDRGNVLASSYIYLKTSLEQRVDTIQIELDRTKETNQKEQDDLHLFYLKQLKFQNDDLERYIRYDRNNLSKIDELSRDKKTLEQRLHYTHSNYIQTSDSLASVTQDLQRLRSDFNALLKFLEMSEEQAKNMIQEHHKHGTSLNISETEERRLKRNRQSTVDRPSIKSKLQVAVKKLAVARRFSVAAANFTSKIGTRNAAQFHTAEVQTLQKEFTDKGIQTDWTDGGKAVRHLTQTYPTQQGDIPIRGELEVEEGSEQVLHSCQTVLLKWNASVESQVSSEFKQDEEEEKSQELRAQFSRSLDPKEDLELKVNQAFLENENLRRKLDATEQELNQVRNQLNSRVQEQFSTLRNTFRRSTTSLSKLPEPKPSLITNRKILWDDPEVIEQTRKQEKEKDSVFEIIQTYSSPEKREVLIREAFNRRQLLNFILKIVLSMRDQLEDSKCRSEGSFGTDGGDLEIPVIIKEFSVLKLILQGKMGLKQRATSKKEPTDAELRKAGEKKFVQMLGGVLKYHKVPRVKLFAQLIGLLESSYTFQSLLFYARTLCEISDHPSSGFHLHGDFVVFDRTLLKGLISQKFGAFGKRDEIYQMFEIIDNPENQGFRTELIDFDRIMTSLMPRYQEAMNSVENQIQEVFSVFEKPGGLIDYESFMLLTCCIFRANPLHMKCFFTQFCNVVDPQLLHLKTIKQFDSLVVYAGISLQIFFRLCFNTQLITNDKLFKIIGSPHDIVFSVKRLRENQSLYLGHLVETLRSTDNYKPLWQSVVLKLRTLLEDKEDTVSNKVLWMHYAFVQEEAIKNLIIKDTHDYFGDLNGFLKLKDIQESAALALIWGQRDLQDDMNFQEQMQHYMEQLNKLLHELTRTEEDENE